MEGKVASYAPQNQNVEYVDLKKIKEDSNLDHLRRRQTL